MVAVGRDRGEWNGIASIYSGPQQMKRLSLYTDDLPKLMHHLDQIRLCGHHGVDVLVGRRSFIDHTGILAALDVSRCRGMVLEREAALRLGAAELPPGAMGAGMETLRIAVPRTMKLRAPMLPGMMPSSPSLALTAPLRVSQTSAPK